MKAGFSIFIKGYAGAIPWLFIEPILALAHCPGPPYCMSWQDKTNINIATARMQFDYGFCCISIQIALLVMHSWIVEVLVETQFVWRQMTILVFNCGR